jgi:CheY-like chemotaxis protein
MLDGGDRVACSSRLEPELTSSHRVLVADDAADLRQLLCLLLEVEDDFVVVGQAGDGLEAVRAAGELQPDLVVLDVSMPVMDGMEALPKLRAAAPEARLVVFSGLAASEAPGRDRSESVEPDAWVEKGTGVVDLVDRLREVCERPR